MAASKFVRRNTVVDLEIEGNTFTVDFGRDDIPVLMGVLAQKTEKRTQEAFPQEGNLVEALTAVQEESKRDFEQAVNGILGDETASDRIFSEDSSMSFHSDVYEYLTQEYVRVMSEPYPEYSPNRAQRRAVGK